MYGVNINPTSIAFVQEQLPLRTIQILKLLSSYQHPLLKPFITATIKDLTLVCSQPVLKNRLEQQQARLAQFESLTPQLQNLPKDFYEKFYSLQLSSHLIMAEYLSLAEMGKNLVQQVDPLQVAVNASQQAQAYVESTLKVSGPEIQIMNVSQTNTVYVKDHLENILYQLLKNALAASVKVGSKAPIKLVIAEGTEDLSFKVSDEGGGIPLRQSNQIWSYQPSLEHGGLLDNFGRGLFRSRLLARYFGGDLELISMDGHGTDVYLHLYKKTKCPENILGEQSDADWLVKMLQDYEPVA